MLFVKLFQLYRKLRLKLLRFKQGKNTLIQSKQKTKTPKKLNTKFITRKKLRRIAASF